MFPDYVKMSHINQQNAMQLLIEEVASETDAKSTF